MEELDGKIKQQDLEILSLKQDYSSKQHQMKTLIQDLTIKLKSTQEEKNKAKV